MHEKLYNSMFTINKNESSNSINMKKKTQKFKTKLSIKLALHISSLFSSHSSDKSKSFKINFVLLIKAFNLYTPKM